MTFFMKTIAGLVDILITNLTFEHVEKSQGGTEGEKGKGQIDSAFGKKGA